MTTVTPIVPPVIEGQGPRESRRRWWIAVLALSMLLAGVVAASLVRVPYYALAPGRPVATTPLVSVAEGADAESAGEIFLTTISLGRASALEAVVGWLRPTVDVVKEEVILPPNISPNRLRQANLDAMDASKDAALAVAFEVLGFDAIQGSGATVAGVLDGGAAAGVLTDGDTIVGVGDRAIEVSAEVSEELVGRAPGETVELAVEGGDGAERQVEVTLGENPDAPGRPFLGVLLQTRDFALDFPFEVAIDSVVDGREIGGPSAGLAFTLELLDRLTEGDLTGGLDIAATGEIGLDGRVLPIGGAAQKGAAVDDAGIDLFLVPAANEEQARRHADHTEVVAVETLDEALSVLEAAGGDPLGPLAVDAAAA